MTVAELIAFLQTLPQGMMVAYSRYSEQCLLEAKDMEIREACEPRSDGWVQNAREDMRTQTYLILPGN